MKKQLLSIFAALASQALVAQTTSPSWTINQNANFPASVVNAGVKFMDAVDANVVWAIGFDAASPTRNYNWYSRTTNGGSSFAGGNIFSDTSTYIIANLEGVDANTAWISSFMRTGPGGGSSGGAIHRTTNGGSTWVNMNATGMFTATTSFANVVTFLTPLIGVVQGDPVNGEYEIWRTVNGGLSWTQIPGTDIPDPVAGEFFIVNLYAKVGSNNLWFGTNSNRMYRSTDGGLTYSASLVGGPAAASSTITEIAFTSPLNGVCYMTAGGGTDLWQTTDGGINWNQVTPLPTNLGLFDVTAIPNSGILVSYGAGTGNEVISYSTDNGTTWTSWGGSGIPYLTGDFVDVSTGWAGSFNFTTALPFSATDVWKYHGTALTNGTIAPVSSFTAPTNVCLSGPVATVMPLDNSQGGSSVLSYTWSVLPSGPAISGSNSSAPTISFSSANTYTVILLVSSASGTNMSTQIVNVAACSAPVVNLVTPANVCNKINFNGSASVVSGAPAPSFSWSTQPATGVTLTPGPFAQNPSFKAIPGTYTISLVSTNGLGSSTSTVAITVPDCSPSLSINIPTAFCADDANPRITISNSTVVNPLVGSQTYTWNVSPTGSSNFTTQSNPTSLLGYSFTVRNSTKNFTVTLRSTNAAGTATLTKIISSDLCTGLNEQSENLNSIVVYPNPAHDIVYLEIPKINEKTKIEMVNVLGAKIFESTVSANEQETVSIKLNDKPKGVYFVTLTSGKEKVTKKLIVE